MVNITDIDEFISVERTQKIKTREYLIDRLFSLQKTLIEKYKKHHADYNMPMEKLQLIDSKLQDYLKELNSRGNEELAEGYKAYLERNSEHFYEELVDALAFYTELCIFSGISASDVSNQRAEFEPITYHCSFCNNVLKESSVEQEFWRINYEFSIAMNVLKNKPWKKDQITIDVKKYKDQLIVAYSQYIDYATEYFKDKQKLFDCFYKKHRVNIDRIENGY